MEFRTAVCIVEVPEKIRLLADFTRSEILQLLCEQPMTEAQLSKQLGLTKAAIGYHLNLLMNAELIYIERVEAEEHGILQKFYSPIAALMIMKYDYIPKDVKRYFLQTQIVHLRGIFIALQLNHHFSGVLPEVIERLAEAMARMLTDEDLRQHVIDAGKKRVADHFSNKEHIIELADIYRREIPEFKDLKVVSVC